ncbi:MAG: putative glycolipid-binding domain-containing protein [Nitriliruptoraceae bacterium]
MERIPITGVELRPIRDADADGLIRLVAEAYDEHPGCVLDLPGVDDDLPTPETTAAARGGRWWVLERDGEILGSIGTGAVDEAGVLELKRCYLAAGLRGRGLATRLIKRVEAHAAGLGAEAIELWSDTRFTAAHHRYEALGYQRTGEQRDLHDPSETTEYRFVKTVDDAEVACTATWDGPHGSDRAALALLPDGAVVRGEVGGMRYDLEVDAAWRPRLARLRGVRVQHTITSDGAGRWWQDGLPVADLAGCTDAGLADSPAAVLLPTRRLGLGTGEGAAVRIVTLGDAPDGVRATTRHYHRSGARSWRIDSPEGVFDIEAAEDQLPGDLGDDWRRRD